MLNICGDNLQLIVSFLNTRDIVSLKLTCREFFKLTSKTIKILDLDEENKHLNVKILDWRHLYHLLTLYPSVNHIEGNLLIQGFVSNRGFNISSSRAPEDEMSRKLCEKLKRIRRVNIHTHNYVKDRDSDDEKVYLEFNRDIKFMTIHHTCGYGSDEEVYHPDSHLKGASIEIFIDIKRSALKPSEISYITNNGRGRVQSLNINFPDLDEPLKISNDLCIFDLEIRRVDCYSDNEQISMANSIKRSLADDYSIRKIFVYDHA